MSNSKVICTGASHDDCWPDCNGRIPHGGDCIDTDWWECDYTATDVRCVPVSDESEEHF